MNINLHQIVHTDYEVLVMMVSCFTFLSTLFKSYQDDGRLILKSKSILHKRYVQTILTGKGNVNEKCHYENLPIKIYTENFTTKNEIFQIKNSDIFHISAQGIDQ